MLSSPICLDASFVVRVVTGTDDDVVHPIWRQWRHERRDFVAPILLRFEVTNALYRYQQRGVRNAEDTRITLRAALALPIQFRDDDDSHERALSFAARFNFSAAYDAHYLGLADRLGTEFWTADKKLAHSVSHALPWVHLVDS
jgi:predicted nucleic acid-binding protein